MSLSPQPIKAIIGLGNPGTKYQYTRHNIGFRILDYLADRYHESWQAKDMLEYAEIKFDVHSILLIKPQTFMNESGKAIRQISDFYKLDTVKDILIVHDDKDLPLGTIRATESSSAAGHNGVQDIIDQLGNQNFHRIRIGVESRNPADQIPTEAFVLQNFTDEEIKKLREEVFPKVNEEIKKFINLKQ